MSLRAQRRGVILAATMTLFSAGAGVRAELHVFDAGGHGFGLRGVAGKDAAAWPSLVESWALQNAAP